MTVAAASPLPTAKDAALAALKAHARELESLTARALFADDPARCEKFSASLGALLYDYSKHVVTSRTMQLLIGLLKACGFEEKRANLFAGRHVNTTEGRAALHMVLRDLSGKSLVVDGASIMKDVEAARSKMLGFAEALRSGAIKGATGAPLTTIVNIGIGGSDLGPAMAVKALKPFCHKDLSFYFIANVDGADLGDVLPTLDAARTLFIIASKTFTTQETMANAATARAFVENALGADAVKSHFAAVSTNLGKVAAFGILPERQFGFWDFVGGRYSIWSSIGLSLAIALGEAQFLAFLAGGETVDRHFLDAPLEANIPVLMGLLALWHRVALGRAAHAVIPYDQRLARFPAYLQQLDMESLGKSVTLAGTPVSMPTGAIIFGEPGTNGQHAFFQLLHQGTDVIPVDFLIAAKPTNADESHHALLFANCLAQSEALMRGRTLAEARALLAEQGLAAADIDRLAAHKEFSGSRPSSTLLYEALTPHTLGMLIALYEHRVFVQSVVFDINPFDQWGVELGKELANRLVPLVADDGADLAGLDASTALLLAKRRMWRRD